MNASAQRNEEEQRDSRSRDPAVIARFALTQLVRKAIAPTPENYRREYYLAAGVSDDERAAHPKQADSAEASEVQVLAAESAQLLLRLVETVGQTTSGLSLDIDRFDGDLRAVVEEVDQLPAEGVRGLLHGLTASGVALQKTVEASKRELFETRKQLKEVSAELERSRAQAITDALTGLMNRRGMDDMLIREIARTRRSRLALSISIIDIDNFKRVNDEYGHDVGDRAIAHVATIIKSALRESDVVCRYGGEEFLVLLPESGIQGAQFVVDRLRASVEKSPLPIDGGKLHINISAGVAELNGDESREQLFKRADDALLEAKRTGRNRVVLAKVAAART